MNREILFKAIDKNTLEWVEGSLLKTDNNTNNPFCSKPPIERYQIVSYYAGDWNMGGWDSQDVILETICQFTGETDKNQKKVFEGDYDPDGNVVVWCEECCGWQFGLLDIPTGEIVINCQWCEGHFHFSEQIEDFEVIGNIHDKLLKK